MTASLTADAPVSDAAAGARPDVRAVTDPESAFFDQNGWVLLRELVSPELCAAMLERAKARLSAVTHVTQADRQNALTKIRAASADEGGTVADIGQYLGWWHPVRIVGDPLFSRAALSRATGDNVRRLLKRDLPMRILHDIFVCKLPEGGSTPTDWHQDSPNFPLDRNVLTIWVALDEITPEMGPVQFYSGSHRCGFLSRIPPRQESDVVKEYPELARFPISPPHHMQPGDATVHHGLTVHSAGTNLTSRPRWSHLTCYFPADTRYTGAPNHDCDGFGLEIGEVIDHPTFSLLP